MFRQIVEYRANKVLYNFIASNHLNGLAILPANICHEVVDALKCTEMEVRYVDISPETFCMDEEEVMSLADRAQLVLYVMLFIN